MLKFIIDECLSPILAGYARQRGYEAHHVNWLGKSGHADHVLAVYAVGEDAIFVTNNGADFKPLYRALDVHPGLVILLPRAKRADQVRLFTAIIDFLDGAPDCITKLIVVDENAHITITDLPPEKPNQ
jgi:predicted nuclease of predicted toxin-antitoxin system